MKENNNIQEESIIEKYQDGSYLKKIIYKKPTYENFPSILSEKILYNSDDREIKVQSYEDKNCQKLVCTFEMEYTVPPQGIIKQVWENVLDNGCYSLIAERENLKEDINKKTFYYSDKEFKNLCLTTISELLDNGNILQKTVCEAEQDSTWLSCETVVNDKKQVISAKYYSDKNFENLSLTTTNKFNKNDTLLQQCVYETVQNENWLSCKELLNNKSQILSGKYYSDKDFKDLVTIRKNTFYNDGTLISKYTDCREDAFFKYYWEKYDSKDKLVADKYYKGKFIKKLSWEHKFDYNEDGSYTTYEIDYSLSEYNSKIEKYNSDGRIILSEIYKDKSFKNISSREEYIYDENDNCTIKAINYEENASSILYMNSENKAIRRQKYFDTDFQSLDYVQEFEYYSDETHLVKSIIQDGDDYFGIKIFSTNILYDANAKILTCKKYKDKDFKELYVTEHYFYNEDGSYSVKGVWEEENCNNYQSAICFYNKNGIVIANKRYKDKDFQQLYYSSNYETPSTDKFVIENGYHEYSSVIDKKDKKGRFYQGTRYKNKDFTDELRTTYRKYSNSKGAFKQVKCYKEIQDGNFNTEFEVFDREAVKISSKKYKMPRFLAKLLLLLWL